MYFIHTNFRFVQQKNNRKKNQKVKFQKNIVDINDIIIEIKYKKQ